MQTLDACEAAGQKFADAWFKKQETMTPLTYVCVRLNK